MDKIVSIPLPARSPKKTSKSKQERACVNRLVKAIQKNSSFVHIHIDRDSGSTRHTSSGWDFLITTCGHTVFCEAKMEKGKLTDWQKFTQAQIEATRTPYRVVRFSDDGKKFYVDGGDAVPIDAALAGDFL